MLQFAAFLAWLYTYVGTWQSEQNQHKYTRNLYHRSDDLLPPMERGLREKVASFNRAYNEDNPQQTVQDIGEYQVAIGCYGKGQKRNKKRAGPGNVNSGTFSNADALIAAAGV